ncbi:MAG: trypsin-like serine protease, partial [Oscillospiraceae bacterium]|nr:trypsin-like serine protease [Oscillospiraceae bacterium]
MKKKTIKKSVFILALCYVLNSSLSVSASTVFTQGDIDGNGISRQLSDIVTLGKFCKGQINLNPDLADVNRDGVVNYDDVNYLTENFMSLSSDWLGAYTVEDTTATASGTWNILKHNYENDSTITYAFSTSSTPSGISLMDTPTLPFVDDRVPYSNNAIVQVGKVVNGVFQYGGTGFIIDENKVVTAAHCVRLAESTSYSDNFAIKCNGGQVYMVSESHIPAEFIGNTINGCQFDYGLLKVNTSVDLSVEYGKFELGIITDTEINLLETYLEEANAPEHIAVAGYYGSDLVIDWGTVYKAPE